MVERQTRDAQNVVPLVAWEFKSPLGYLMTRVSQRSAEFHKLRPPGATPGPATHMTGYANWQSDEVESLVPVGSTPTSVTIDPVVQRQRRLGDNQESDGSIPSGITARKTWSVGAAAAHRFGKAEARVRFPDGPLT